MKLFIIVMVLWAAVIGSLTGKRLADERNHLERVKRIEMLQRQFILRELMHIYSKPCNPLTPCMEA